jgi:hypothetical protein
MLQIRLNCFLRLRIPTFAGFCPLLCSDADRATHPWSAAVFNPKSLHPVSVYSLAEIMQKLRIEIRDRNFESDNRFSRCEGANVENCSGAGINH